jgi:CheY-like chemotaxis protein
MYRQLRTDERLRDIPVIMFSAVPGGTFGHALRMLGVAGEDLPEPFAYIEKPPRPEEMLGIVLSALDRPGPRRNANAQEETPHGV